VWGGDGVGGRPTTHKSCNKCFPTANWSNVGLALTDLAEQFLHIKTVYGNLPADYLDEFHSALDRTQTQDTVATVLDRLLTYFGMRAAVHATLSEYDKIKMLRKAFNWGIYKGVLRRYLRDHEQIPRLPPQAGDQLYLELATALLREEAMNPRSRPAPYIADVSGAAL
jgi:hypothetical protein